VSIFDNLPETFVATFGEVVTITPVGGSPREITAIFRREADRDSAFDRGGQIHTVMVRIKATEAHDITDGAIVSVGGTNYVCGSPGFDGRGMAVIELRRG